MDLLNKVYGLFSEDEQFPVFGGSVDNAVDNAAGKFNISNADEAERFLCYPAGEIAKIDSAASLTHMMNQNTFTAAAYHITGGADAAALADGINKTFQARHWMCGFPDKIVVASADDYLISVYGNEDLVDIFVKHLSEAYSNAKVLVNEPLSF